jgi:hypothetical protein
MLLINVVDAALPECPNELKLAFDGSRHAVEFLGNFFVRKTFELPQSDGLQRLVIKPRQQRLKLVGDLRGKFRSRFFADDCFELDRRRARSRLVLPGLRANIRDLFDDRTLRRSSAGPAAFLAIVVADQVDGFVSGQRFSRSIS